MYPISCFNGEYVRYEDLCIHVSDLGLQRGYGIFDFFEIIRSRIKWQSDYFARFYNSAEKADLPFPFSRPELESLIEKLVIQNNAPDSFIKLILTGGFSKDGFTTEGKSNFIILNVPPIKYNPKDYSHGIALIQQEYLRPNPEIKSLNYLQSAILQKKMALYQAKDVLYHFMGRISETSRANIFMVKDGELITPAEGVLAGVTRKHILKDARNILPVVERDIEIEELLNADEVFISSTTKYIMPVVKLEDQIVGGGRVGVKTRELMSRMKDKN